MLQQFEDALVQYDELDALFSQYVVNFGAGGESVFQPLAVAQQSLSSFQPVCLFYNSSFVVLCKLSGSSNSYWK